LPKSKIARPETKVYVMWVKEEIKARPALFDGYTKGHGIIARERFLRWLVTAEGENDKESDKEGIPASEKSLARRSSCLLRFPVSEEQPSLWLLRNCSNLGTHKATMFGSKRRPRFHSKCQEVSAKS